MSTRIELQKLKRERSDDIPFPNLIDFEKWADQVLPLLSFSESFSLKFSQAVLRAKVTYRAGRNTIDATTNMNEAIGVLNQALIFIQTDSYLKDTANKNEKLQVPEKLTFPWLVQHVDIKHWFFALSVLTSIFCAGIWVGQSGIYKTFTSEILKSK